MSWPVDFLEESDMTYFVRFCAKSELNSLMRVKSGGLLPGQVFLVARMPNRELIGCTSFIRHIEHRYFLSHELSGTAFGTFFCSTEVDERFRGRGVGAALYSARYSICVRENVPLIVEILGTGRPYEVADGAFPGWKWHLRRKFECVGYSRESDCGPVLIRAPAPVSGE